MKTKQGIIYVLVNETMPGLVKIGITSSDITNHMDDFYTTGVPLPFECLFVGKPLGAYYRETYLF